MAAVGLDSLDGVKPILPGRRIGRQAIRPERPDVAEHAREIARLPATVIVGLKEAAHRTKGIFQRKACLFHFDAFGRFTFGRLVQIGLATLEPVRYALDAGISRSGSVATKRKSPGEQVGEGAFGPPFQVPQN